VAHYTILSIEISINNVRRVLIIVVIIIVVAIIAVVMTLSKGPSGK
jgi:hypothetical protein